MFPFLMIRTSMTEKMRPKHPDILIKVSRLEAALIRELRMIQHGDLTVFVQDGLPIRVEQIRKSKKLSESDGATIAENKI